MTFGYIAVLTEFSAPTKWIYQIQVKCPVSEQLNELIFADAVYAEFGMTFLVLGAYMGLIIDAKYYQGTVKSVNKTAVMQTLLRLLISIIPIVAVYVCPVYLIQSTRYVFLVLLFKYALPTFLIGVILFGYSKQIY